MYGIKKPLSNIMSSILQIAHYTSFGEMKKRDNALDDPTDENGFFNRDVIKKDGGFFRKGGYQYQLY